MKEEDQVKLAEFVAGADFTSEMFRDIFSDLIEKHVNESLRQHTIRALIEIWIKRYPAEADTFQKQIQQFRAQKKDVFASAGVASDQRIVFKFPETLWNRLNSIVQEPPFLQQSNPMTDTEKEEWAWMIKEFPQFVVPERI
jgi:metal-responsive CopG/Arc/MetJ family transcriptional regulator